MDLERTGLTHSVVSSIDTTIANGVANPNAHGHATTRTLTNANIAVVIFCLIIKFNAKDNIAIINIAGTK